MDYARFARLTIGIGTAAIVAAAALSMTPSPNAVELVAMLLLLAVLVGAVQWGRRGGTITAIATTVIYVFLRVPDFAATGLSPELVRSLLLHTALYGLVGIGGGEACARMKSTLARARDALAIDEASLVYTPRYIGRLVTAAIGTFARYGAAFSVIVLSVERIPGARSGGPDDLAREIGTVVRRELRLVDDVGRLSGGAFVVLLPQTATSGARVVASRLRSAVAESLRIDQGAVDVRALSALEDLQEIEALVEEQAVATA